MKTEQTQQQTPPALQLERLAKIVVLLAEANNVTRNQVVARIKENRELGRPQFDMMVEDWSLYGPTSPTKSKE